MKAQRRTNHSPPLLNIMVPEPTTPSLPSALPPNKSIDCLLQDIDALAVHRTSQLFISQAIPPSISSMISADLKRIAPICHSHQAARMDLNPSHVFLSPSSGQSLPIMLDSDASTSILPCKSDFTCLKACSSTILGINSTTQVHGEGMIRWTIVIEHGKTETIETFGYYVPSICLCLYSPQSHFCLHPALDVRFHLTHKKACLLAPGFTQRLSFPLNPLTNLPMMITPTTSTQAHYSSFPDTSFNVFSACSPLEDPILSPAVSPSVLQAAIGEESNPNLSRSQLELLGWYYCLGHVCMSSLQPFFDRKLNSTEQKK